MVNVLWNEHGHPSSNLDVAVFISHTANTPGKDMHLPQALGIFSWEGCDAYVGLVNSQGDEKLWEEEKSIDREKARCEQYKNGHVLFWTNPPSSVS